MYPLSVVEHVFKIVTALDNSREVYWAVMTLFQVQAFYQHAKFIKLEKSNNRGFISFKHTFEFRGKTIITRTHCGLTKINQ